MISSRSRRAALRAEAAREDREYKAAVAALDPTTRVARCGCGNERPSSPGLAFFQFRGEGSRDALAACKTCWLYEVAHVVDPTRVDSRPHPETIGHAFEPHGAFDVDLFYDGCRGWD